MINFYQHNESRSIKHTPNVAVQYRDNPDDLYRIEFTVTQGDDVVLELTGATASDLIIAFMDGAHRRTLRVMRDIIEDKLNE
jgi:hypothetical protein